jgi:phosphoglycerate dehydrogenase-like enzyme
VIGKGLASQVLGIIGLGQEGRELALAAPLGPRVLGYGPHVAPGSLTPPIEQVGFELRLSHSDYVCVCCALTPATVHLLSSREFHLMNDGAVLINVARGAIVHEAGADGRARKWAPWWGGPRRVRDGALSGDNPLLFMSNVIVTPHDLSWTWESFLGSGQSVVKALGDIARGRMPAHVANRDVKDHPRLTRILAESERLSAVGGSTE